MKKTIYLIRHGQTDDNLRHVYQGVSKDNSLNKTGQEQARLLGQWMKDHYPPPELILSSPARRPLETACVLTHEIMGNKKGCPIYVIREFHEINHGDWEGKSDEQVQKEYSELYKLWHEYPMQVRFPNGESMRGAKRRILKAWVSEVLEQTESIIMLVAHAGVNFQIINDILESNKLRNVHQHNTCLNIIERGENGFLQMQLVNSTAHLF